MTLGSDWVTRAKKVQLGNYKPAPLVLVQGRGSYVEDVEGRTYLDFSGGIAVLSVGHAHPMLARAIAVQAERLIHTSNLFYNDKSIALAEALTQRTAYDRVYFCNSGAEANETMLKLARRFHHDRGDTARREVVSTFGSFHGRTMGALSLTGQTKYHEGMAPLLPGILHVPFGDVDAIKRVMGPQTAAVIVEPIQAEGGIVSAPPGYLLALRQMCDATGALLLLDEVQTGYGRTGRFLAQEHEGVVADATSLAKGIAGGFPLGAVLVRSSVADGLPPGSHATTFGGNPLACSAGLAVLSIFDEEQLIARAEASGRLFAHQLNALVSDPNMAVATGVRGQGLLCGVSLHAAADPAQVLSSLRDKGLLASLAGGTVLRLTPPLNVTTREMEEAIGILKQVFLELSSALS